MVTLLLAETQFGIDGIISKVENMCHSVGIGVIVHHAGDSLDEILDSIEGKVIAFSPAGAMSLDEFVNSYDQDVVIVIGGYTEEKDLDSQIIERADATVTLGDDFLELTDVVERIIDAYGQKR